MLRGIVAIEDRGDALYIFIFASAWLAWLNLQNAPKKAFPISIFQKEVTPFDASENYMMRRIMGIYYSKSWHGGFLSDFSRH
jgi:hypothetical protein